MVVPQSLSPELIYCKCSLQMFPLDFGVISLRISLSRLLFVEIEIVVAINIQGVDLASFPGLILPTNEIRLGTFWKTKHSVHL